MIELTILLFLVLIALAAALYVLGFRLGRDQPGALTQVRLETTEARRQMHDVDHEAFVAIVDRIFQKEEAERVDGREAD